MLFCIVYSTFYFLNENLPRKYISHDGQCIIFHQNNYSCYNTMDCELCILRFKDSTFENELSAAHTVGIDIRWANFKFIVNSLLNFRYFPNGNFKIKGQSQSLHGEFNGTVEVRKELTVTAMWWRIPQNMTIFIDEYQLFDLSCIKKKDCWKRKLLCKSTYYFYEDTDQSNLQKCVLTITDGRGCETYKNTYSQIDRWNRKFYTNQLVEQIKSLN